MNVAVVTVVHGRHEHLRRQLAGLSRTDRRPDQHVVVALADAEVAHVTAGHPVTVVSVPAGAELPLAHARNVGATTALAAGADLLVFLDVDCIPSVTLIERYVEAAADHGADLLCGPVAYLPPAGADGYDLGRLAELADPHPARPVPPDHAVVPAEDRRLFWSLSFAVTDRTWTDVGGFWPEYVGYGAEDTDYVESAHRAGIGMSWVGGATAYHQHHPVSTPPVEHLEAIVRNAQVFRRRWGWWPMTGWLDGFVAAGLVTYDGADDRSRYALARSA